VYLRFIQVEGYVYGRHRPGIIRGMADSRYWKRRSGKQCAEFERFFDWLNEELPRPPRAVFELGKALCWFKPGATVFIERMRNLASMLRGLEVDVRELLRADPGRITYQDPFQVVAVPTLNVRFRLQDQDRSPGQQSERSQADDDPAVPREEREAGRQEQEARCQERPASAASGAPQILLRTLRSALKYEHVHI
jgi:hypothetical protein